MSENLLSSVPTLQVKDAIKSCAFYCDVLGFKKNWEHSFGPGFPLFVSVSRGPVTLFLTEHPESAFGALIYFYVKDIDSLSAEFISKGATLDFGPADQPWGVREAHLHDIDGNRLRFGQPLDKAN